MRATSLAPPRRSADRIAARPGEVGQERVDERLGAREHVSERLAPVPAHEGVRVLAAGRNAPRPRARLDERREAPRRRAAPASSPSKHAIDRTRRSGGARGAGRR
jgi:hypothetical protein